MKDKNLYDDCPLIDGAYDVLKVLNEKYELYIVTAYLFLDSIPDFSGKNLVDKYHYLKEKLPFISPNQYIFMEQKSLIHSDIAIDDRVDHLSNADQKILMDAWHNRDLDHSLLEKENVQRVSSWQEILELLDY